MREGARESEREREKEKRERGAEEKVKAATYRH